MTRHAHLAIVAAVVVCAGCGDAGHRRRSTIPAGVVAYGSKGGLWSVRTSGAGRRRLTRPRHAVDVAPAWSPDGRQLAFLRASTRRAGPGVDDSQLWVVGRDGAGARRLPVGSAIHDPAWSPGGHALAYSRRGELWVYDLRARRARPLGAAGGCPTWSPDARRIAFCGVGSDSPDSSPLEVLDLSPRARAPVMTLVSNGHRNVPGGWSADGRYIAFSSGADGQADIYRVAAHGGKPSVVLARPGAQSVVSWLPGGQLVVGDSPPRATRTAWLLYRPADRQLTPLATLRLRGDPIAWLSPGRAIAHDAPVATAAGRLVPVGRSHLFAECEGRGPVVVLDSGLGVASDTWRAAQRLISRFARVCRYDRPGNGLSPPLPGPHDAGSGVVRLRALMRVLRLRPPYVLVGASFGGLQAQLFAYEHPRDVAGLVLLDALHPDLDRRIERLLGAGQARERRAQLEQNAEGVRFSDLLRSDAEVRRALRPLRIPLVVVRHGRPFRAGSGFPAAAVERLWARLQQALAAISPQGRLIVAHGSRHRIAQTEPALVAQAVRDVLAQVSTR